MEFEYTLENAQQFWDELDDILNKDTHEHKLIDDTLRTFLGFVGQFENEYLVDDDDVLRCAYRLITSPVFRNEQEYVRTQIVYCLLQEDASGPLHVVSAFVLYDGRQNESTFETLNEEGGFPRIVEMVQEMEGNNEVLHRLLLELLYEMCRIQRVKHQDLVLIDEDFIIYLLRITEGLSADVNDPYHYYVIRVLLVLNEQYMVCAHDPGPNGAQGATLPNLVIKALSNHGQSYKTFGENIILLLNRESETSLQLLILKLLYLLFTTVATHEYFYTNDLRVLVDVMIRNLLDLAYSSTALRHTYLRVLYPLLAHTQLRLPDYHYKRDELLKLLNVMAGGGSSGPGAAGGGPGGGGLLLHFGAMDETTRRLVKRCMTVDWLLAADGAAPGWLSSSSRENSQSPRASPPSSSYLQIGNNPEASRSSLSVAEVSAQHAAPGERTLSRSEELARQQQQQAESAAEGMTTSRDGDSGTPSPSDNEETKNMNKENNGGGGENTGKPEVAVLKTNRAPRIPPSPPKRRRGAVKSRPETKVEG